MENNVRPYWSKWFPRKARKSMVVTGCIAAPIGLITLVLGVTVFRDYGLVLFTGVPIALGILAPALHGIGERRSFLSLLGASIFAEFCLFICMFVFGIEGIVCILMAAPLWLACAILGTCIAYPIHVAMWRGYVQFRGFPVAGLIIACMMPAFMGAEHVVPHDPPLRVLSTTIDIDAAPDVVWRNVVSFPDMPRPRQWIFSLGVARPIRAEIEGTGITATRYCVFSTGKAVEPIRIWEPGHLLELDVASTPPSMEELSIYHDLHPPHLEGYLISARARFELIRLPGNKTRLVGTSWYLNRMSPGFYWDWWSDQAIKAVQVSVLAHIKQLSESAGNPSNNYREEERIHHEFH